MKKKTPKIVGPLDIDPLDIDTMSVERLRRHLRKSEATVSELTSSLSDLRRQTGDARFANGKMFRYTVRSAEPAPQWKTCIFDGEAPAPSETEQREVDVSVLFQALADCMRFLEPHDVPHAFKIVFGYDPPPAPKTRCKLCGHESDG